MYLYSTDQPQLWVHRASWVFLVLSSTFLLAFVQLARWLWVWDSFSSSQSYLLALVASRHFTSIHCMNLFCYGTLEYLLCCSPSQLVQSFLNLTTASIQNVSLHREALSAHHEKIACSTCSEKILLTTDWWANAKVKHHVICNSSQTYLLGQRYSLYYWPIHSVRALLQRPF